MTSIKDMYDSAFLNAVEAAYRSTGFNQTTTAALVGVSRGTLRKLLKRAYGDVNKAAQVAANLRGK